MPDDFPGALLARRRQADTAVFLIDNQRRTLRGQFLQHSRYRSRADSETSGESIAAHEFSRRSAEFQDRLKVIVHGLRGRRHYFRNH